MRWDWPLLVLLLTSSASAATPPRKSVPSPPGRPAPRQASPPARNPADWQPDFKPKTGPRAFLEVETWYLDYEVTVVHQGPGMEMHSNTTAKAALNFSDMGPSITMMDARPTSTTD